MTKRGSWCALAAVTLVVALGCSSKKPASAPRSPGSEDRAKVSAAQSAVTAVQRAPRALRGRTPGFDGRSEPNLSEVSSQWTLVAKDLRRASDALTGLPFDGAKLGDAQSAVLALADAAEAVGSCVSGLAGDWYMTAVDRECPGAWNTEQERLATANSILSAL